MLAAIVSHGCFVNKKPSFLRGKSPVQDDSVFLFGKSKRSMNFTISQFEKFVRRGKMTSLTVHVIIL